VTRHVLVTGAAGGIGRATVEYLQTTGVQVLGVDLHGTSICCDLADPGAREALVKTIQSTMPKLDAVVAAAGVLHGDPATVVAVNFFGATRLLESLRPLLAQSPSSRALVLSSTSSRYPCDEGVIEACLSDDEAEAIRLVNASTKNSYAATKAALARWVRRRAVTSEWGGNDILLNALAPGMIVDTGMTRPLLDKPGGAERLQELTPTALGRFGTPDDMARLIAFLVGADNRYIAGQVIYADGGCDALQRGDSVW
jgi:NAD(P)-dependent dehydrogenase (short-subunit alcohol dehydrogenase family)